MDLALEMTAQMQQMNAHMVELKAQMQQMHAQINGRLDQLSQAINSNAAHLAEAVFLPFPNQDNVIPAKFPRSNDQLKALTGPEMMALLHAYNIGGVPNTLEARRARVKRLITTGAL